jgi:two-component system cell cycle response regulator
MNEPAKALIPTEAADLRDAARPRVLLSGKIIFAEGGQCMDCAIRDLSKTGARVRLNSNLPLPGELYLVELRSGIAFECRVAWRRLPEVGLQFLANYNLETDNDPRLKPLKRIWIEHVAR